MPAQSDNIGCAQLVIDTHPSPFNPDIHLASIRGLDVTEACDGYSAAELRSIARFLENIADGLEYSNRAASTKTIWEQ